MKIYRLDINAAHSGTSVHWFSSERETDYIISEAKQCESDPYCFHHITSLDITTTRAGILRFLNAHTPSRDNG